MKKILVIALLSAMSSASKAQTIVSSITNAFGDNPNFLFSNSYAATVTNDARATIWLDNNGKFKLRNVTGYGFAFTNAATNQDLVTIDDSGNMGIGTMNPTANLEVNTNAVMGSGAGKGNTALTLVKNGDIYGTDNPVLILKHSGNGVNIFGNPASDLGILQIKGFNTGWANKSINSNDNFYVFTNGTVGINTSYVPNGYNLAINGSAIATSMTVQLKSAWPDFVFKPKYQLKSLSDLKTYIDQNHHLPDMPSASEVEKDGLNLGEMNKLLTKKVEELTLYLIEKDKQLEEQNKRIGLIEKQLSSKSKAK